MALAPLRSGPHTVRADRLAFATPVPVREAGGAGHWVTVGHHGEDDEGGGVHIFISSGGTVEKGPRGLVGHHIGAVASHPSAGKVKHHPVGHEPPGARDHPHYAEAAPNAERQPPSAGPEPAKRPGKPYARLHGAEQGTRHAQIGKALGEAQEAAKGAKAAPPKPDIAALERAEKQARSDYIAASTSHRKNPTRHEAARQAHATALKALQDAQAPAPERRVADTAVAHQQAQAALAAHRAANDRNPNPWAPHLSPPALDAKDRELAEKATRAQLAHQAAQAQQIEAAHQRLQQQAAQPRDQAQPVLHSVGKPGESDSEREQRLLEEHKQHKARFDKVFRAELGEAGHKERRALVDRMNDIGGEVQDIRDKRQKLGVHAAQAQQQGAQQQEQTEGQRAHKKEMVRLKHEQATEQSARAAGASTSDARILANQVRAGHGLIRGTRPHNPEQAPAFTAPQPKAQEKPQTAPQPEQGAGRRAATQKPPHHMTEPEYVSARHAESIAHGQRMVEKAKQALAALPRRAAQSTRKRLTEDVAAQERYLRSLAEDEKSHHTAYRNTVKDAIKHGHEVPEHVLAQRPEFRKAYEQHKDERRRRASFYGRDVRESGTPAPRFSAPVASAR